MVPTLQPKLGRRTTDSEKHPHGATGLSGREPAPGAPQLLTPTSMHLFISALVSAAPIEQEHPSTVLKLSNTWAIATPLQSISKEGTPDCKKGGNRWQSPIVNAVEGSGLLPEYYYADGERVVLKTPCWGASSGNCEVRTELKQDPGIEGSKAKWWDFTEGVHYIWATMSVDHVRDPGFTCFLKTNCSFLKTNRSSELWNTLAAGCGGRETTHIIAISWRRGTACQSSVQRRRDQG